MAKVKRDKTAYGIKIKNFQAGSLYQCNLGIRQHYDYNDAMLSNSLFLDFLKDNGLRVEKGWTRDIVCINFDYGSRSYDEEKAYWTKKLENEVDEEKIERLKNKLTQVEANKDLYVKKTKDEIRSIFYSDGIEIRHDLKIDSKTKEVLKSEYVTYKMLYRSTGKAKGGSCMFICERLYKKAQKFLRMGLKPDKDNAKIVEMGAYQSLIASTIVGRIKIDPKNILVVKDVDTFCYENVLSVETDENKQCKIIPMDNYKVKSTMFDGEGLIDASIFPAWGNGYVLLRHHMTKVACFHTNIQKFFKDYYGDNYETTTIVDMFGVEHYAKDIKLITTDNAMKWLNFDVSYEYWCDRVYENGCNFGIVKTAHKSKLGDMQRMSYQMINSLSVEIMPNVVKNSLEYIDALKNDDEVFLQYLRDNDNFAMDYKCLVALCEHNPEFVRSSYFRERKTAIIKGYIDNFRFGKVIQNADNLVFVGSPYALLLHSVGEDVMNDHSFECEDGAVQCFTTRFDNGKYLACFRSPHNSAHNIAHLHNVYSDVYFKYFNLGEQIIVLNTKCTSIEDRLNGCDFDSDMGFVTDQEDIVQCAKEHYINFPTVVNNIPKSKVKYSNSLENYAIVDNKLASAQSAIGESSNLAQFSQSYMYSFPNEKKYREYVGILAVIAQCAIDNAKRVFDVDIMGEIARIKKDMDIDTNGYPVFWKYVKAKSGVILDNSKINRNLICPMNYLANIQFAKATTSTPTLPMEYFFKECHDDGNIYMAKKIEELVSKYSMDLFVNRQYDNNNEDYQLSELDYDLLIDDITRLKISQKYIALVTQLIDRAFVLSTSMKQNASKINTPTAKNKSLLLKVLYDVSPKNVLEVFSKNLED